MRLNKNITKYLMIFFALCGMSEVGCSYYNYLPAAAVDTQGKDPQEILKEKINFIKKAFNDPASNSPQYSSTVGENGLHLKITGTSDYLCLRNKVVEKIYDLALGILSKDRSKDYPIVIHSGSKRYVIDIADYGVGSNYFVLHAYESAIVTSGVKVYTQRQDLSKLTSIDAGTLATIDTFTFKSPYITKIYQISQSPKTGSSKGFLPIYTGPTRYEDILIPNEGKKHLFDITERSKETPLVLERKLRGYNYRYVLELGINGQFIITPVYMQAPLTRATSSDYTLVEDATLVSDVKVTDSKDEADKFIGVQGAESKPGIQGALPALDLAKGLPPLAIQVYGFRVDKTPKGARVLYKNSEEKFEKIIQDQEYDYNGQTLSGEYLIKYYLGQYKSQKAAQAQAAEAQRPPAPAAPTGSESSSEALKMAGSEVA